VPGESSLLVVLRPAQLALRWARWRFDPSARSGIPAHITVLYPFLPPAQINQQVLQALEATFSTTGSFAFRLSAVEWFDDRVAYIAVEPPEPFVSLTQAVMARFPGHEPYGGTYESIVPHLTIGVQGERPGLARAAERVAKILPIEAKASEVHLMVHGPGARRWRLARSFALGAR